MSTRSKHNSLEKGSYGGESRPPSAAHRRSLSFANAASSADISSYSCGEGSKKLQIIACFILLFVSLIMVGTGAGLMGFYRLHLLDAIAVEFIIVPFILLLGGIYSFLVALFGLYVTLKEDSCLMITYAVFLGIEFLVLIGGVVASVRLIFEIRTGLFDADIIPELNYYEADSWVRYKWDTLQRDFTCCGAYGFSAGYTDWKHTVIGGQQKSVPDSCCVTEAHHCGKNVFVVNDPKKILQQIHLHGCISILQHRLENHVAVILMVFSVAGGILAIMQILGVVLACCFANQISKLESDFWDDDEIDPQMRFI